MLASFSTWLEEISLAFVPIIGAILILMLRRHNKKITNIDSLLNNVEIDLVDGDEPGAAPSIRQKLNDLSNQLQTSIDRAVEIIQKDRRLDREESNQQRKMMMLAIEDIKNDIDALRMNIETNKNNITKGFELAANNSADMKETKALLVAHMNLENQLVKQYLAGEISAESFIEEFQGLHTHHEDML